MKHTHKFFRVWFAAFWTGWLLLIVLSATVSGILLASVFSDEFKMPTLPDRLAIPRPASTSAEQWNTLARSEHGPSRHTLYQHAGPVSTFTTICRKHNLSRDTMMQMLAGALEFTDGHKFESDFHETLLRDLDAFLSEFASSSKSPNEVLNAGRWFVYHYVANARRAIRERELMEADIASRKAAQMMRGTLFMYVTIVLLGLFLVPLIIRIERRTRAQAAPATSD